MTLHSKFGPPVLLLALTILLASCGGSGGGEAQRADHGNKDESGGMSGMKGMDHGSGGMASGMLMKNGEYSDERFIDAMVPHHEGAVEMAKVALKNAEHPEIKQLAENIITTQRTEIKELESIKQEEFGSSRVPTNMNMGQMRSMGMMMDPGDLANENPFDKAFIDSMIPHHQSAIEMARVARDETNNPKIKELATNIFEAQRREISQMKQWRERWYRGD
ncbi:MAG: DUF305 domain-containing protein [Rubrobacter sp.]|nr:DUF305 domain-containing protein [Rubrobacter sp.]